jgi:ABC-type branched-subunit amino acid transport system permease subunit
MAQLGPSSPPSSPGAVILDIKRLNLYGWWAWLLLTLVAGTAALILTNPAFGTRSDYVQCFLWSFGIAAAGQLTTLGLGSVSSALGIPLVKP